MNNNGKISCCMIATNLMNRCSLIENTIESLNKCNDIFSEKIMSVDVFGGGDGVDLNWFEKYNDDWKIHYKNKDYLRSMILNQQNVLNKANNEIIFYLEDDIVINDVPQLNTIDKLFNGDLVNGKPVGFISYNNHIWVDFNQNPKHVIDFIINPDNYTSINGDLFLIKNMGIKDRYYLNFPVSIFNKSVLLALHEYAINSCRGMSVEAGLTKAWFDLKYNDKYEVLIYVKSEILADIRAGKKITVLDFYNYANMNFWNNDENLRHPSVAGRSNNVNF